MEEICADGIVSPDEYEKFEIVKAVYLELSENRDELQASILTSDETLPLIIAYLE